MFLTSVIECRGRNELLASATVDPKHLRLLSSIRIIFYELVPHDMTDVMYQTIQWRGHSLVQLVEGIASGLESSLACKD